MNATNRHSRDSMRQEDMKYDENGKRKQSVEREQDEDGAANGKNYYLVKKSQISVATRAETNGTQKIDAQDVKLHKQRSNSPDFREPSSAAAKSAYDHQIKKQVQFNTQSDDNEQNAGNTEQINPDALDSQYRDGAQSSQHDQQTSFALKRIMRKQDEIHDDEEGMANLAETQLGIDIQRTKSQKENLDNFSPIPPSLNKQLSQKVSSSQHSKQNKQHMDELVSGGGSRRPLDMQEDVDADEDGEMEEEAEDAESSLSKSNRKRHGKGHNEN